MKKIFTYLLAVFIANTAFSQTPHKLSYQAVIRDASNSLVTNQAVGMQVSILKNSALGTLVYSETQSANTNANGLVSIEIGGGNGFDTINWSNSTYYLKTETDPAGGTNYTIVGVSQLLTVPYALHAETAKTVVTENDPVFSAWDKNYNDLINKPTGNVVGDMQFWNGTNWVMVPVGQPGQYLQLTAAGTPAWSGSVYPTVTTNSITNISKTAAASGGFVSNNGGSPITSVGICFSTSPNPTINDNITSDTLGTGLFTSSLNGLTPSTTYYLRAYAINNIGIGYGNEISFTTLSPALRDTFQGGIIFYFFQAGDPGYVAGQLHGLVAAPSDQGSGIQWGCAGTSIGGTNTAIGSGMANTVAIVNGCTTTGIAAEVCYNLSLNGYTDWFLPSTNELNQMYINLQTYGVGGFALGHYWTSCETNANSASKLDFLNGSISGSTKSYTNKYVRAVRAF